METDLHRIIYSRQALTIDHVQYFVYQILRGLKYIHSANVIHRDLKPSNLLVNANCDLKICDFGLARGMEIEQAPLTEYVVTRWYRAPEIMLACHEYTKAIDVWSVGCIFAELLARQALFPGDDYLAQLRLICEKLGRPAESDLDFVTSERAKRFIASLPQRKPIPMGELFPEHKNEREAHDLLRKMLEFHPHRRITIDSCLAHPFMSSLHNPEDEPEAGFTFHFAFEEEELSKQRIQELIWAEIRELYPDLAPMYPGSDNPTPQERVARPSSETKGLDKKAGEADGKSPDVYDDDDDDMKASSKK
jgi:mitogen-activated protein kinase 1/3